MTEINPEEKALGETYLEEKGQEELKSHKERFKQDITKIKENFPALGNIKNCPSETKVATLERKEEIRNFIHGSLRESEESNWQLLVEDLNRLDLLGALKKINFKGTSEEIERNILEVVRHYYPEIPLEMFQGFFTSEVTELVKRIQEGKEDIAQQIRLGFDNNAYAMNFHLSGACSSGWSGGWSGVRLLGEIALFFTGYISLRQLIRPFFAKTTEYFFLIVRNEKAIDALADLIKKLIVLNRVLRNSNTFDLPSYEYDNSRTT